MGTKYSSQSATGYNASPPADDGSQVASNEILWSTIKTKLPDPIKDFADNMNSALLTHFDESVIDKAVSFTTTTAEHKRTINVTAAATISLGDATTMAVGYVVTVKNSHTAPITVDLATGADTLDGTAAGSTELAPMASKTFITNTSANGYFSLNEMATIYYAADIASAATLPTPNAFPADVTGTTGITAIATSGTIGTVIQRKFLGVLTLTHHATNLVLPGGLDIVTAAGDYSEWIERASGQWECINYQRNNGQPVAPVVVPSSLYGLTTALDTDTDHDVLINVGICADSTNVANIDLTAILTKRIDLDWVEGDDAGGLATGSRSVSDTPDASTWYHYFVISKLDGTVDAGWDTSLTATNLLADASTYTYYRRIASHFSNGSSNISAYTQSGDSFLWTDPVLDMNNATVSSGGQSVTLTTPFGIKTNAYLYCTSTYTVDCDFLFNSLDQNSAVPGATNRIMHQDDPDGEFATAQVWIRTNTSSQIRTRGSVNGTVYVRTQGWNDPRID